MLVVDAHSHLYPRWYIDALAARRTIPRVVVDGDTERFQFFPGEGGKGRAIDRSFWDISGKLAFMAANGIDQAVVTLGNPWLNPFRGSRAARLAEQANAALGKLETETGGRLVGLGVLPGSSVEAAARVAADVARTPGLHGLASGYSLAGHRLDDRRVDPVWKILATTGLPLYLHPHDSMFGFDQDYGHVFPVGLGFPFETTVAVTRLVLSGVLERFPTLRIVLPHGGGCLPYVSGRIDAAGHGPVPTIARALARLYFDVVVYSPATVKTLLEFTDPAHLLFGTDHPYRLGAPDANRKAVHAALGARRERSVLGLSAIRLFGLPPVRGRG
jgi:predicted TIM-barrel fold metal-dependent hydrolase